MTWEKVFTEAQKHSRRADNRIQYGTAGFRAKADTLDHVMYRMGLLAVLRSCCKKAAIGVMITASHNPEEDNGVKLVDPLGEMIEMKWEAYATELVNVPDDGIAKCLQEIASKENIEMEQQAIIFLGRDTRPSSVSLCTAVKDGVGALNGELRDIGLVSTPQLHYTVACFNTAGSYGEPSEEGYFNKITSAFKKLRKSDPTHKNYKPEVKFDGANGVGALKMKQLLSYLGDGLKAELYNNGEGKLNFKCGADFVKSSQGAPENLEMNPGDRCVSVDGDADRILYFYMDSQRKFHLLDGDKIATLVAGHLKTLLGSSGLQLELGLVQTAYANGASTDYISQQLCVPVACVPTGVKHLHHKALDYDIGVYFEANGHGTVVFSEKARSSIKNAAKDSSLSESQSTAAVELEGLLNVINETVGDALSDMLLVESVLHARGWSVEDWDQAYTDLPNRLLKVQVKDRNVITTTNAERQCVTPQGLQAAVDEVVKQFKRGRSFVRASGTEDVVRVYAEAETQQETDSLATKVGRLVFDMAGGVGEPPSL